MKIKNKKEFLAYRSLVKLADDSKKSQEKKRISKIEKNGIIMLVEMNTQKYHFKLHIWNIKR